MIDKETRREARRINYQAARVAKGLPPKYTPGEVIDLVRDLTLYAAFLVGLVWVLSQMVGCAISKVGVTQEQANRDAYECRREARTITRGAVIDAYRDCMHARGYK